MALKEIRILIIHTYVDRRCFADAINSVEMGDSLDESREINITCKSVYTRAAETLVCMLLWAESSAPWWLRHTQRPSLDIVLPVPRDSLPLHKPGVFLQPWDLPSACNNYTLPAGGKSQWATGNPIPREPPLPSLCLLFPSRFRAPEKARSQFIRDGSHSAAACNKEISKPEAAIPWKPSKTKTI